MNTIEYGRKPYISPGASYSDLVSRVTTPYVRSQGGKSELDMKKPYDLRNKDYNEMIHYHYAGLDYLSNKFNIESAHLVLSAGESVPPTIPSVPPKPIPTPPQPLPQVPYTTVHRAYTYNDFTGKLVYYAYIPTVNGFTDIRPGFGTYLDIDLYNHPVGEYTDIGGILTFSQIPRNDWYFENLLYCTENIEQIGAIVDSEIPPEYHGGISRAIPDGGPYEHWLLLYRTGTTNGVYYINRDGEAEVMANTPNSIRAYYQTTEWYLGQPVPVRVYSANGRKIICTYVYVDSSEVETLKIRFYNEIFIPAEIAFTKDITGFFVLGILGLLGETLYTEGELYYISDYVS